MKSIPQINDLLDTFSLKYDYPVVGAQQGSEAWFNLKLGVISASNASKAVAKKGSETRKSYMYSLISQVVTGQMQDLQNKYVDWGKHHEDAARATYEMLVNEPIDEVPFVFKDSSFREGCSPDAIVGGKRGLEIKCPYNTDNYVAFLVDNKIKPEYQWQYQYAMRVLDCDLFDFVQFDPRVEKKPIKILSVERDPAMQEKLDNEIPEFIAEMDKALNNLNTSFGSQWKKLKEKG